MNSILMSIMIVMYVDGYDNIIRAIIDTLVMKITITITKTIITITIIVLLSIIFKNPF